MWKSPPGGHRGETYVAPPSAGRWWAVGPPQVLPLAGPSHLTPSRPGEAKSRSDEAPRCPKQNCSPNQKTAASTQGATSGDGARDGVPTRITYNFKYNIAWHKPVTSGRTPATTSSRFAQFRVCLSARRQCPRHVILYGGSKGLVEYGIGAVQLHSRRQAGR